MLLIREAHQDIQYWSSGLNQNYQIVLIDFDYCLKTKLSMMKERNSGIYNLFWAYLNNKNTLCFERIMAHVHSNSDSEKNLIGSFYFCFITNEKIAILRTVRELCGCVLNCTGLRLKICSLFFTLGRFLPALRQDMILERERERSQILLQFMQTLFKTLGRE